MIIPKLGKSYLQIWAQEEIDLHPELGTHSKSKYQIDNALNKEWISRIPPKKSFSGAELYESGLSDNNIRCAPITERILCSLVRENVLKYSNENLSDDDYDMDIDSSIDHYSGQNAQVPDLEMRLKQELCYIGILSDEEVINKINN